MKARMSTRFLEYCEEGITGLSRMCQKAGKAGKRENDRDFNELGGLKR